MNSTLKKELQLLRENSKIAYVSSVNEQGYPQIKGMLVLEHDSLLTQYFSTNYSSRRVQQFLNNPKASVYYCCEAAFKGALFTGSIEVCTDAPTKTFLWRDGFEMYYPNGIEDEDYCVLKFTAESVNYYHGLTNHTLLMKEL